MSAPSNTTPTPSHGVSVIAARLMQQEGRHRIDPRNPDQWRASELVSDRKVSSRMIDRARLPLSG
jgi:hypothetical protein